MAYLILAGLSTPLVLSVHTVVSFDFATSVHPRLAHHDLPAVLRRRRHLLRLRHGDDADGDRALGARICENLITIKHLENMNKIILATGIDGRLRVRARSSSSPGTAATRTSGSPSSTARSARMPGRTGR